MYRILLVICIAFGANSCKTVDKLTQFNMEYTETVVIPSIFGIFLPFNLWSPNIETNSEKTFEINNTRKKLVEHIVLNNLELVLTSPSNRDLSFLESISVYIKADGLTETRIAWEENVPVTPGSSLVLNTTDADLKKYIKKDNFTLRINTVTDKLLTADHYIDINCIFFVDAKVLGQ